MEAMGLTNDSVQRQSFICTHP